MRRHFRRYNSVTIVRRYPGIDIFNSTSRIGECNKHFHATLCYAMLFRSCSVCLHNIIPISKVPVPTSITSRHQSNYTSTLHQGYSRDPLVSAVHGPVNASNISIAVGDLAIGMGETASLAALGQERDISATSRGGLPAGLAQHLYRGSEGQGVVAGVEAGAGRGLERGDGVGELREADAGLARASVDAQGLLAVGAGAVDREAGGVQKGAFVGEDIGGAEADLSRGAVDVEDAARGGGGVVHKHGPGIAGGRVVGRHDEVVDRGREVVGRDVGYQAEVGRGGLGRVDWAGGGRSSAGHAHEAQDGGEGES